MFPREHSVHSSYYASGPSGVRKQNRILLPLSRAARGCSEHAGLGRDAGSGSRRPANSAEAEELQPHARLVGGGGAARKRARRRSAGHYLFGRGWLRGRCTSTSGRATSRRLAGAAGVHDDGIRLFLDWCVFSQWGSILLARFSPLSVPAGSEDGQRSPRSRRRAFAVCASRRAAELVPIRPWAPSHSVRRLRCSQWRLIYFALRQPLHLRNTCSKLVLISSPTSPSLPHPLPPHRSPSHRVALPRGHAAGLAAHLTPLLASSPSPPTIARSSGTLPQFNRRCMS
jgi:hypothetical protein